MAIFAFDTETWLIRKGLLAPRMVCLSYCDVHRNPGLLLAKDGVKWLRERLLRGDILVGDNVAYDMAVVCAYDETMIPVVFDAYDNNQIRDTMLREQLSAIYDGDMKFDFSSGKPVKRDYHLATLVKKYTGREMAKEGTYRLRYAELDEVPVEQWPQEARDYAIGDAVGTMDVFMAQGDGADVTDESAQCRAHFALHLMSCWGVRTDGAAVAALKAKLAEESANYHKLLQETGIFRPPNKKGEVSKNMEVLRKRVVDAYAKLGRPAPRTEPSTKFPEGQVQTSGEVCIESGDEALIALAELDGIDKLLNNFVPILEQGTEVPINARYNPLVTSGRTSCEKPPMQQLPRKGGVRECFVPRPGFVYAFCDYDTLELRALAQACLWLVGHSEMAKALHEGQDLHLRLAATLLGITYEEAVKLKKAHDSKVADARQMSKAANFGYPGGMAPETFVEYAKASYGVVIDPVTARNLFDDWRRSWPEMADYHGYIKKIIGVAGEGTITQLVSGRVRGGCGFCDGANTFFQGLAADGAKRALWAVTRACYARPKSPLYGSRPVIFMHDEIGAEVPEAPQRASAAAQELGRIMREEMQVVIPDVPVTATPALCRRWYKGAEAVYTDDGLLVPWEPEQKEAA